MPCAGGDRDRGSWPRVPGVQDCNLRRLQPRRVVCQPGRARAAQRQHRRRALQLPHRAGRYITVTLPLQYRYRYRYNTVTLPLRYHYITVTSRSNFRTVQNIAPHMFEHFFNGALLAYKLGDFQEAYDLASKVT